MSEAARLLRHARRRAGLTQRALAALAGVPQPYVARVESSRTDPSVTSLSRLLRACAATLEALPGAAGDADREAVRAALARPPAERLPAHLADALRTLPDAGSVVVGAAAAALHGAPGTVGALDVCLDAGAAALPPPARVVGTPPGTTGYADVAAGAVTVEVAGLRVRVAALDDLIRIARAAGDGAATGVLLALRDELAAAP